MSEPRAPIPEIRTTSGSAPAPAAGLPAGVAHLLIEISQRQVAVPLGSLVEVVDVPAVSELPLAPDWLSGATNLRGRVVPVVNLGRLLGWETGTPGQRALVLRDGRFGLAMPVEVIQSVRWLELDEPSDAHAMVTHEIVLDSRTTWVLNAEAVLTRVRRGAQAVTVGR